MIDRYVTNQMKYVWSERNKYTCWGRVEVAHLKFLVKNLVVREDITRLIDDFESFNKSGLLDVHMSDIKEFEKETKHDVVAYLRFLAVMFRRYKSSRFIHYGLTSSDVVDSGMALQLAESWNLIEGSISSLKNALIKQARYSMGFPCIGRTHGVHAQPMTMGLKFARFWKQIADLEGTLRLAFDAARVGKLTGAVGTSPYFDPWESSIHMASTLGPYSDFACSQVVPRWRYAHLLNTIAVVGGVLESIATEIRHLQRTEVREMSEGFSAKQKGSSAMSHKRNPIGCENICGLSRVLRGNALAQMESINLWHERDISHSSVERICLVDSVCLIDYMLNRMANIVDDIKINRFGGYRNWSESKGVGVSESVMMALIKKGVDRWTAHDWVQSASNSIGTYGKPDFVKAVLRHPFIKDVLTPNEIKKACDYKPYLVASEKMVQNLVLGSKEIKVK